MAVPQYSTQSFRAENTLLFALPIPEQSVRDLVLNILSLKDTSIGTSHMSLTL
jgi:hypothetical protein